MSAVYRLTTSLDACLQCGVQWNLCPALKKPHWLHSELLKHWLHSPKDALSTFFTAPHTFPELYCETWLLRQGSVPRVCGIVQKVEKAFVVFFKSCLSAEFVLILRGREGTHTWYLSFFLHCQNFWRIKFTPKNATFSRKICRKCQFFALNL